MAERYFESGRTDRGWEGSYSCAWMVIYPCGNRRVLDIAQVRDYQKDEWALASHQTFIYEYDARDYAIELAAENGLRCACDPDDGILD